MKRYIKIQEEMIEKYRINICENSTCWGRTHAHIRERKICKWKRVNSIKNTFTLFHEIGHIETTKSGMRRCEEEYYATAWAIEKFKEYGLKVPEDVIELYQDYINREHDRGIRRGGKLPDIKSFQLIKNEK